MLTDKNKKTLKKIYREEYEKAYTAAKTDELQKEMTRIKEQARKDAQMRAKRKYQPSSKQIKEKAVSTRKKAQPYLCKLNQISKNINKQNKALFGFEI